MTYAELKTAVLDLAYLATKDSAIDVGPTYSAIQALAAELRGADMSAVAAIDPMVISELRHFEDRLAEFFEAIPPGFVVKVENRNS